MGICQGTLGGGGGGAVDSCEVGDYATPVVAMGALPGNASAIQNALSGKSAVGGSPLAAPLKGAIQYLRGWAQGNPNYRPAVVLVSDNAPNICSESMQEVAQAGFAGTPSVRTYVIKMAGADGTADEWNQIAQAGGTSVARTVTMAADMQQALEAIRTSMADCP